MTNEQRNQLESDLPAGLSAPAQRALAGAGISRLDQVAAMSEAELLALHGLGPKTIRQLRPALEAKGMSFAEGKMRQAKRR
jgi:predicted flap endonuclease-1-like 5' DNA nuclease